MALGLWGAGCTSNWAALTSPGPQTLGAYLASTHPSDIQVTDKAGDTRWIHNPVVDGDSLRGVRGHDLPRIPIAIAITQIAGIEEPHFSAGRTLGLIGGVVAVVTGALLIIASRVSVNY